MCKKRIDVLSIIGIIFILCYSMSYGNIWKKYRLEPGFNIGISSPVIGIVNSKGSFPLNVGLLLDCFYNYPSTFSAELNYTHTNHDGELIYHQFQFPFRYKNYFHRNELGHGHANYKLGIIYSRIVADDCSIIKSTNLYGITLGWGAEYFTTLDMDLNVYFNKPETVETDIKFEKLYIQVLCKIGIRIPMWQE